ncbi:MAG: hypothetical protein ACYDH6_23485 [Acidimicrobiales bacterium]
MARSDPGGVGSGLGSCRHVGNDLYYRVGCGRGGWFVGDERGSWYDERGAGYDGAEPVHDGCDADNNNDRATADDVDDNTRRPSGADHRRTQLF